MKKIRIGIFGSGRGVDIAHNFKLLGCEIAAVCESDTKRANKAFEELGKDIPVFKDFDEFLEQDLDAVVLANFFHEHAPYAVKCFKKNIHVLSECISNSTLAEGVDLIRAYEKSDSVYMLAENYPQMIFNREMKRICDGGTLGKILYAYGEYNHPFSPDCKELSKTISPFPKHWRNYLPRTYYLTHSLAPLMWSTGATPVRVSATPVYGYVKETCSARQVMDKAAIITTLNDDASVFSFTGCAAFGGHGNSYRICGTDGQIENIRGTADDIMLRYNDWSVPEGMEEINHYTPKWNDKDEELIKSSGHGGGDFIVSRMFLDCIRDKKEPEMPYDIYSAITMSAVAILAHRSVLNGGIPYEIPDYKNEETRKELENDTDTPFFYTDGREPTIPCCSNTDYKVSDEQMEEYLRLMKE